MRLDRLDVAWFMLVGLALATVAISSSAQSVLLGNAVVLMLAVIKGRKIVLDYLDLRNAPALWRGLVMAWVILLSAFAWATAAIHVLI